MLKRLVLVLSLVPLAFSCDRPSSAATSPGIDPAGTPVGNDRREQAATVVRRVFDLRPGQEAVAPVLFVGAGEAAIVRDSRAGLCAILYEHPEGGFLLYKLQKGGDLNTDDLMLHTRGTIQGGVTARELEKTYRTRCH